jgi:hypothetical protein
METNFTLSFVYYFFLKYFCIKSIKFSTVQYPAFEHVKAGIREWFSQFKLKLIRSKATNNSTGQNNFKLLKRILKSKFMSLCADELALCIGKACKYYLLLQNKFFLCCPHANILLGKRSSHQVGEFIGRAGKNRYTYIGQELCVLMIV